MILKKKNKKIIERPMDRFKEAPIDRFKEVMKLDADFMEFCEKHDDDIISKILREANKFDDINIEYNISDIKKRKKVDISSLFAWAETLEGHEYWSDIMGEILIYNKKNNKKNGARS